MFRRFVVVVQLRTIVRGLPTTAKIPSLYFAVRGLYRRAYYAKENGLRKGSDFRPKQRFDAQPIQELPIGYMADKYMSFSFAFAYSAPTVRQYGYGLSATKSPHLCFTSTPKNLTTILGAPILACIARGFPCNHPTKSHDFAGTPK